MVKTLIPLIGLTPDTLSIQDALASSEIFAHSVYSDEDSRETFKGQLYKALLKCSDEVKYFTRDSLRKVLQEEALLKFLGCRCSFNSFPRQLELLEREKLLHFYYLELREQKNGWTCGYWAAFNADALNFYFQNYSAQSGEVNLGEFISAYVRTHHYKSDDQLRIFIDKIADCCEDDRPSFGADTTAQHIDAVLKKLGLKNINFVELPSDARTEGHQISCYFPFCEFASRATGASTEEQYMESAGPAENDKSLVLHQKNVDKVIEEFKIQYINNQSKHAIHHFCCFFYKPTEDAKKETPHWYLVSLIKVRNVKPFLMIFDSYNFKIVDFSDSSIILSFLYNTFLHPLQQIPEEQWRASQPVPLRPHPRVSELEVGSQEILNSSGKNNNNAVLQPPPTRVGSGTPFERIESEIELE